MREDFLQFIWQYQLQDNNSLKLPSGEKIEVIHPGTKNLNSGPDFFNARIKIGNTIWAGNIEVHIKSSDWNKHGHNQDKAFDNVILQVVLHNDYIIKRSTDEEIPTIELKFKEYLFTNYQKLQNNELWIACQNKIKIVDNIYINQWLEKLSIERLEQKSDEILERLKQNRDNWEETFYQFIGKNFGLKLNAVPFELLTKSLPLKNLAKHKSNLLHIEAMLFGQSGMLNNKTNDDYQLALQKEYFFFKQKFNLAPIDKHLWKFLRLRPSNFPTVRIAQLAALIFQSSGLFSRILESDSFEELEKLFDVSPSEYWRNHYVFGKESAKRDKKIGKQTFYTLVINTITPFTFVYGKYYNNQKYKDKALYWLEKMPSEKNNIIDKWENIGIMANNAFYSQALLQLKNVYCNYKRCLYCSIGNKVITLS